MSLGYLRLCHCTQTWRWYCSRCDAILIPLSVVLSAPLWRFDWLKCLQAILFGRHDLLEAYCICTSGTDYPIHDIEDYLLEAKQVAEGGGEEDSREKRRLVIREASALSL